MPAILVLNLVNIDSIIYVGYIGGAAMLPEDVGGQGFNAGQAHQILAPFVEPIAIAIIILLLG